MTANLELWLVRHGETTRSVAREIAGWSDPPLTARGRGQASALRPKLEGEVFDGVWSSDLRRAKTTASLAWGDCASDPRLREFNFGEMEEAPFETIDPELATRAMRFRDFQAPGGENNDVFRARLEGFLEDLPPGRHLLFVHGGVIRSLAQDLGLDRFVATGSVVGVDWSAQSLLFVDEPEDAEPVFEG
ncbi:MAG: histidine phosphatase family protein [Acidobacteriota bacterium]